jgi:hypothetical protein
LRPSLWLEVRGALLPGSDQVTRAWIMYASSEVVNLEDPAESLPQPPWRLYAFLIWSGILLSIGWVGAVIPALEGSVRGRLAAFVVTLLFLPTLSMGTVVLLRVLM